MLSLYVTDLPLPASGWKWTFAYGAALVLLGLVALSWPFASAIAIGLFLGWALFAAGAFGIAAGLRAHRARGHKRDAAVGLLSLVLGLLILLAPLAGALTLLYLMSFWFAVAGVVEIMSGWRHKRERLPLLALGGLDLLLSILAGLSFLASGLVTIVAALQIRMLVRERLV
jgi:uncharacterized membrane protein HdeD (DUF308 family)